MHEQFGLSYFINALTAPRMPSDSVVKKATITLHASSLCFNTLRAAARPSTATALFDTAKNAFFDDIFLQQC
jgi:hypothetical protein